LVYSVNRRGQLFLDVIFAAAIILIASFIIVVGGFIYSNVNDGIQSSSMSDESKATINQLNNKFVPIFDNIMFALVIGLWISLILSSIFIDASPIFMIVTIIGLVIAFVVIMIFANVYSEFSLANGDLSFFADEFVKISWIYDHFLQIFILMGFSATVALYMKPDGGL